MMSREFGAEVKIEEIGLEVGGHYKTEFTAPFIVPPCELFM